MGSPERGVGRYGASDTWGRALRIGKEGKMGVISARVYFDRSSGNRFGRAAKMRFGR